ncbi:hypothetical protein DM01DRAFT_1333444 [Hesseltinella vesiculosa]|uniref:FAM192A/Fyv6 N-terminal domain-containing protein n=1 Tax=Hesseltinella vesiculosa TaxID=101127 RepID=A0A1X2GPZ7_9FUNG|nr:hypothetical protein DM01DRAFT_1333444 [Hesseltinella vesiculosa]
MSFKSFVSRSIVTDNEEKDINTQDASSVKASSSDAEYDPRTLYERLQEQKLKKEDEFREKTKFSNLVKRIDEEDAEYYQALSETQHQQDTARKAKDELELEEFRKAVESTRLPPSNNARPPASTRRPSLTTITSSTKKPATKKESNSKMAGLVLVKKRSHDEASMDDKPDTNSKKPKTDKTKTGSSTGPATTNPPAATTAAGLGSLLADYGDSGSESE